MHRLKGKSLCFALLFSFFVSSVSAEFLAENHDLYDTRGRMHNNSSIMNAPVVLDESSNLPENSERMLPVEGFTFWGVDELPEINDQAVSQHPANTSKKFIAEQSVVQFNMGDSRVSPQKVRELGEVIDGLKDKKAVRLNFIGHTDNTRMSARTRAIYKDNLGLSKARAEKAARYFQRVLGLNDNAISWEGRGESEPIASNETEEGKLKNRRVEVQVWYEEAELPSIEPSMTRTKVCGTQPMCQLAIFEDTKEKISIEHIAEPIRITTPIEFEFAMSGMPNETLTRVRQLMESLKEYKSLKLVFTGHTDNVAVRRPETVKRYGDNVGLSKARANEVANYFQKELNLKDSQINVQGMGDRQPIASNDTSRGRALNRRVELAIEYDKNELVDSLSLEPSLKLDWCDAPEMRSQKKVVTEYEKKPYPDRVEPVRFMSGEHIITDQYIENLSRLIANLGGKKNIRIHFVGHTDNQPLNPESLLEYGTNQVLSEFRAKRVQEYIRQALGLSNDQVSYEGKGDSMPISSNDNALGMSLNRRVEVEIYIDQPVERTIEYQPPVQEVRVNHDPRDAFELSPFRITVDGQPIDSREATHTADVQRCTDVALENARLQIQYDDLQLKPRLAVNAWPSVIAYTDNDETVVIDNTTQFTAYTNYPAYVDRAEIRLFLSNQSVKEKPVAIVSLDKRLKGQWTYDESIVKDQESNGRHPEILQYVVRVYGKNNLFDETRPQKLWLKEQLLSDLDTADAKAESLVSYGENALAIQNIPFDSGTVTVNGLDIPSGHNVYVLGHEVPVDAQGRFVAQYIIPEGLHSVEVAVLDDLGNGELFHRELELQQSDWFYVGIADLTIGSRDTDGPASTVTQDDRYDDDSYVDGRLAFFAKGKTNSNWEVTASADTREQPIEDLFDNFTDKDPLMLFRRLDSDYYYPTFGDDSTLEELAPTQGKFYFKAQKDRSFGLWGNFESNITDTDLAQIDRALYGAQVHHESKGVTRYGERKTQLDLFAAEPGTQSAREEYRGTGGSLYFLRHQDITVGSERLYIDVRDKDTGLTISRRSLSPGQDYDIDPLQGRVMLNEPLLASGSDGLLVRDGSIAGNENYLIVSYEFTPGFDDLNDIAVGGRISQWLGNHVEIGVTGSKQKVNQQDHKVNGVDLTLRASPSNYIKFEAGQTEGLASEQRESIDGGFAFTNPQPVSLLSPDQKAEAFRVESGFKLGKSGSVKLFTQNREAGYSAPGQLTTTETDQLGAQATYALTNNVSVSAKYSQKDEEIGDQNESLDANIGVNLNEHWAVDVGARLEDRQNNEANNTITNLGERTDVAVELAYNSGERWSAYGFSQNTVEHDSQRDKNNRAGLGGAYQIQDRLKIDAEVSEGDTGAGAKLGTEYQASDRTQLYMAYSLENQRNDTGLRSRRGNLTGGFKSRYTDNVSIYGEERYAYGEQPKGLTHAYGVDLAPTDEWNIGVSGEAGRLKNPSGSVIERLALGTNVGYAKDKIKYAGAIEYRNDQSGGNDRITWLLKNTFTYQNSADWRTLGKLNWSQSESSQGEFFDGDFTELVWGYGYRPVNNDRINTLFKYTYFFNKPAPEQVSTRNANSRFIQRSHILAADVSYDLNQRWTLGGKYAYRMGELATDRVNPEYFKSRAHLFVMRADWHLVRHWDFLVEGRLLELTDADDRRSGFLTGVYRHFGNHLKVGLGYNFTDFSDDLTDLSFDSQGVFLNIVGKI